MCGGRCANHAHGIQLPNYDEECFGIADVECLKTSFPVFLDSDVGVRYAFNHTISFHRQV